MKKNRYIVYITSLFTLAGLLLTACEDVQDEVKDLNLSRYLKVMNVSANNTGGTQVRLNWDASPNAESYVVEFFENDADMEFIGEASFTLDSIEYIDLPYVLTSGLEGNATYSIRVKAVGEKADDSLWSDGITVKTEGEQLFYAIDPAEITHESAIVRWIAGETVTHLLVSGGNWTNQQFNLSAQNIEEGEYEITGLSAETTYTVRLMNGNKQRGEIFFTSGINLGDAIEVTEEDDFLSLISSADPGSIFYLSGSFYDYGKIEINKSITIVSGGNVTLSAQITLANGAGLTLRDLFMDGMGTLDTPVAYADGNTVFGAVIIQNCTIKNFEKRLIDSEKGSHTASSITIDNCIISDIPGNSSDIIDFRSSFVSTLNITNSTFYNCGQFRDFIRMDVIEEKSTSIQIEHCTFYNVLNTGRLLYVRIANDITFTNNIIANTGGYFNNQSTTTGTTFSNNVYFEADLFMTYTNSNATNDTSGTVIDPQFSNPENGNFTVNNENLKYENIGDPRWLP